MTINHRIWPRYNLDLAIIEGTAVETLCGEHFVPTVTVGTSGGAHIPGAPSCEDCETVREINLALRKLQHQMDGLHHAYELLRQNHTLEEIPA